MTLKAELDAARKDIKTDAYPISIRELASLYKEGELDIHPEFQRFLRWSPEQKTKLVESLLLGIPIPSIFVFQREDGVLDVVDGLQRISTILHFMGELRDEEDQTLPPLILQEADYLPALKDKVWSPSDDPNFIGDDIQRFFRQEKIDVKVLLRDSDDQAKYELFQRINTGGTPLSEQEVRNCILIMVNRPAYFWLEQASKDENFIACCPLPERVLLERYDLELALRFAILYDIDVTKVKEIKDLGQFLTTEMRSALSGDGKDLKKVGEDFERTFKLLNDAAGDNALRKFDIEKERFGGPFLISAFELVALGLSQNLDYAEQQGPDWLKAKIKAIWSDPRADGIYGQGVSTARRLPKTLDLGREFFSEE